VALTLAAIAIIAIASGPVVLAHPTASTIVTITLGQDRSVEVAIACEADALLTKLEAVSGAAMSTGPMARGGLDARIAALEDTLTASLELRFDGAPVALHWAGITSADGQPSVIRLTGLVRPGASMGAWRTSLVYGSYPLVIRHAGDPAESVQWLQGPQTSDSFRTTRGAPPASGVRAIWRYFALGFTHILPNGLDHILFVLGLFLLTPRLRSVIAQASAFTLAHSITLGLTLYGVVSAPAAVVEPLIALSIAYVAFENLFTSDLKPWRLALVFGFGLLHGMGFAEALARLDLPRSEFFKTLVTFNIGVEAGQLAVVAAALTVVRLCAVPPARYRRLVVLPASAAIALTGVFWTVERLL
jgi:hypothetical protein